MKFVFFYSKRKRKASLSAMLKDLMRIILRLIWIFLMIISNNNKLHGVECTLVNSIKIKNDKSNNMSNLRNSYSHANENNLYDYNGNYIEFDIENIENIKKKNEKLGLIGISNAKSSDNKGNITNNKSGTSTSNANSISVNIGVSKKTSEIVNKNSLSFLGSFNPVLMESINEKEKINFNSMINSQNNESLDHNIAFDNEIKRTNIKRLGTNNKDSTAILEINNRNNINHYSKIDNLSNERIIKSNDSGESISKVDTIKHNTKEDIKKQPNNTVSTKPKLTKNNNTETSKSVSNKDNDNNNMYLKNEKNITKETNINISNISSERSNLSKYKLISNEQIVWETPIIQVENSILDNQTKELSSKLNNSKASNI